MLLLLVQSNSIKNVLISSKMIQEQRYSSRMGPRQKVIWLLRRRGSIPYFEKNLLMEYRGMSALRDGATWCKFARNSSIIIHPMNYGGRTGVSVLFRFNIIVFTGLPV